MRIKNTRKVLTEIKKGIVIGFLLTSFYGIWVYIYKNQNKNKPKAKIETKNSPQDNKKNLEKNKTYKKINGYEYKWSENENPKFLIRSLGYEKRFSRTPKLEELEIGLKDEYCNAVREIEKVDRGIVPGTNIPFKEATYMQVNDAYKEYLQKIAQIRQILFDTTNYPEKHEKRLIAFEEHIKCKYNNTKWNMDNSYYYTLLFYNSEINDYYSKYID